MIFRHDYPLGFGGPNRVGLPPTRWAENRNRDFPHGTGEIDVQSYMSYTAGTTTTVRTAAQASLFRDSWRHEAQNAPTIAAAEAQAVAELEAAVAAEEADDAAYADAAFECDMRGGQIAVDNDDNEYCNVPETYP